MRIANPANANDFARRLCWIRGIFCPPRGSPSYLAPSQDVCRRYARWYWELTAQGTGRREPSLPGSVMQNGMGADGRKAYKCKTINAVEVAMKYVLLGNLSSEWASKQADRVGKAKAQLDKLGIKIESMHYTQGYYDFVDVVDAPNPEAMLAFSVWYATHGLGRVQSMPAFDAKTFEAAIKDAVG
jgi:uncharacterized protein with GYD domain